MHLVTHAHAGFPLHFSSLSCLSVSISLSRPLCLPLSLSYSCTSPAYPSASAHLLKQSLLSCTCLTHVVWTSHHRRTLALPCLCLFAPHLDTAANTVTCVSHGADRGGGEGDKTRTGVDRFVGRVVCYVCLYGVSLTLFLGFGLFFSSLCACSYLCAFLLLQLLCHLSLLQTALHALSSSAPL